MSDSKTICVFGATGQVGSQFLPLALEAGYRVRALVRKPDKLAQRDHEHVEAIAGNATDAGDVAKAVAGSQLVTSFLGNPSKDLHIMEAANRNILEAAREQASPPRCLFISSIGMGGSSWLIGGMLKLMAGKASIMDYERADALVRAETTVPYALIRPYALTDKPGTGTYKLIPKKTVHFAKPIARADVAKFFFDCLENTQWDGPAAVHLTGA
ncbi:MAG: NAD(P)-binding oxidoreductase [Myxococcota bacterium]